MRVLVTGATGFVGPWLVRELTDAGHEPIPAPPSAALDVADRRGMASLLAEVRPDAIAHLAAVAHPAAVADRPELALRVAVGGTLAVVNGAAELPDRPPVLVTSSSDVYGAGGEGLGEDAVLAPERPYGLAKVAQESVGLAVGAQRSVPVVVTRSFNHSGPGQRPEYALPAFVDRALEVRRGEAASVPAGNVEVVRDITDVRDVVRAYRLLLEAVVAARLEHRVYNVCSGRGVRIREVIEALARLLDTELVIEEQARYRRASDPPIVVGDPARIREATGWEARIGLERTLADMVSAAEVAAR